MKKSIYSVRLDGGTNNPQKREVFKGSILNEAKYDGVDLTLVFELGSSNETEYRHYAVYDSRQPIPDKYLPAFGSISDQTVTLYVFDVTEERIAFNEREKDLVSFGNHILAKHGIETPIITNPKELESAQVKSEDLLQWRNERLSVMEVE